MGVFDNLGDWAGDFFTGDWTNAYEANPYLTVGLPALATAGVGFAAAPAVGAALGLGEAGLAGLGAAEAGLPGMLGFAGEAGAAGAAEGGLASWLGGMGEAGMAGEGLLSFAPEAAAGALGDAPGMIGLVGATPEAAGTAGLSSAFDAVAGAAEPSLLDKLIAGAGKIPGAIGDQVMKNPLGIGAAALGLGMNIGKGGYSSPELDALKGQAGQLGAQGQQLAAYLQSGTLPPGLQAAVKQAAQAAKAKIIANHAKNGMSTNPLENSALAQELAMADQNAIIATAKIGQDLLTTGINEIGMSEKIYAQLVQMDQAQSAKTGQAIAQFAAALNGGSPYMKKAA